MTSVLLVCLGNICRSPMAEAVLRHHVAQRGLVSSFQVDSAGTAAYHAGEQADPRTLAELARHGLRERLIARQVTDDDFDRFDWILAMDRSNLTNLRRRAPAGSRARLHLVLETTTGGEVPDPYYGGPDGFADVYDMLDASLAAWLDRWTAP